VLEIYDPSTGTFTPTENMHAKRYGHAATLLPNGKVLIAGGLLNTSSDHGIASAELYDPSTGTFTLISDMRFPQFAPTASLLPNGKVLIASGPDVDGIFRLFQIYDPDSQSFTSSRDTAALYWHTATLFPNGNVLLAGGGDSLLWQSLPGAALYDAVTGNFQPLGNMTASRFLHTATLLHNGTVLIAGGDCCVRAGSCQARSFTILSRKVSLR
jgi:WD40 repeat protein